MSNFVSSENANSVLSAYATEIKKKLTQVATMPTAAADLVDQIVQYIGATNNNYTNGYFYKCISDGAATPTYSWQNVNVQEGGGSSDPAVFIITLTGSGTQSDPYAVDTTPAKLGAALDAGKYPIIMHDLDGEYFAYPFTWMEDDRIIFEFERFEDYQVGGDHHVARSIKVRLEVNGTDWDTISLSTRDFDLTTKADKVSGATNGNLASLGTDGNLLDSGIAASNVRTGTVAVANGGTGATTAADARTNLGLGSVATESTVPVSKGGTGATTLASGAALIGNGTGAVQTRAITNNTAKTTAPAGSTNLATMNSLLYGMQNYNNRASAVNAADTNYTTYMARAIAATTTDSGAGSALTDGAILLVYE